MYIKKKFRKNSEAVSPVVATLILVLVAVASATAFYLWQTEWQAGQTDKIDDSQPQASITVAGSTTVYELTAIAADEFMKDYPLYNINLVSTGSGAGVTALLDGTADVGVVSAGKYATQAKEANSAVVAYTVGYDAVSLITSNAALERHNITADTWNWNVTVAAAVYDGTIVNWGALCDVMNGDQYFDDAGVLSGTATAEATDNDEITLVDRSDISGTEEYWSEILFGEKEQLQDISSVLDCESYNGNSGVIDAVATANDAIGFASWGVADKVAAIAIPDYDGVEQSYENLISNLDQKNIRPLIMMTVGAYEGLAKDFIQYILDVDNNKDFCMEAGYVSLYK